MDIRNIERKLWKAIDRLTGNMAAIDYMHLILGILFLKLISDQYDNQKNNFIVSKNSHWNSVIKFVNSPKIGEKMNEAFVSLEEDNPNLKNLFNKNYSDKGIDQEYLGEVINLFIDENLTQTKEDLIGRTYEYFLDKCFRERGQSQGGEFYTPKSIVELMINLIKPTFGKIYDPACGSGGLLVQSKKYIEKHQKKIDDVVVYGQEFNYATWKLAKINLILNGFKLEDLEKREVLGQNSANTLLNDQHENKQFDFIMANPPFNIKNWGLEKVINDRRWKWGLPPKNNANFAWLSHIIFKLKSQGKAAVILSNGSLSSSGKQELSIKTNWVKENKIDAILVLPDKLFYTVAIPACIWIFNNHKKNNDILMIDASNIEGHMLSKKWRELTVENIKHIVKFYDHHLQGKKVEEVGFAKTVNFKEIEENDFLFVPGRYVGFVEEKIDKKQIKKELKKSSIELKNLFKEFNKLVPEVESAIDKALKFKIKDEIKEEIKEEKEEEKQLKLF